MPHRKEYKKLVEELQRYVLDQYQPHEIRLVDEASYAFFAEEKAPKAVEKAVIPSFKESPLAQSPSHPKPRPAEIKPLKLPEKGAEPIKSVSPKREEKITVEIPSTPFRKNSEEVVKDFSFGEIEKTLKKIAPNLQILNEPLLSEIPVAPEKPKEKSIILLYSENKEEAFLTRLCQAIKTQLHAGCIIRHFKTFQDKDSCQSFFSENSFLFFLGNPAEIETLPFLNEFFRRTQKNSLCYLGGAPFIPLEKEQDYESEPAKKRELWKQIKLLLAGSHKL
ncbi:hypothetical protein [Criblamydia sequanensis]|uniref:Uncharacterized protein n=1 Tax=Candidatus Criblamydia sequanensis CRIB-18 TaxID=1437425 RepID=A0A090D1A6_9BACT|nr:hypothetical protein [Criblamydia sequanensis]CDR33423.1 hypothetical protein CSEC_0590 [Criblamydia sequanensis CRIB-18]